MKRWIILGLLLVAGCVYKTSEFGCLPTPEIAKVYESSVDTWKEEVKLAFAQAEAKVFTVVPKPDEIIRPDEDPNKCPCKGTGIIVQGDNHKTPCPFHGAKSQGVDPRSKDVIIKQFRR